MRLWAQPRLNRVNNKKKLVFVGNKMAVNLRPCDPDQDKPQLSFKEQVEQEKKIKIMMNKVTVAKKFLMSMMQKKNHRLFEIILIYWIKPHLLLRYIQIKEREAAELLRLKLLAEGGTPDNFAHKGVQLPKKVYKLVPEN